MNAIDIDGIPFETVDGAMQHTYASGRGVVVRVEGIKGFLVVEQKMVDRLAERGTYFAYYFDHEMPDGITRVISVPVKSQTRHHRYGHGISRHQQSDG